ncbi:shikimate dehydrogenase [Marinobacterium aestuarii]|uniref:Shikimate dehydrogenase (NADP(+)) n=1 Tax=Marinobacterium aestuarii TaxID=1821621 RepID=A0A1A9EUL5_9GAMM|nr:shikimate dehydrogenase [Marinobacterium aestuarii]ANG61585.1 shikimate dehydrogenase [Marinobacterium aestuarii]
MTDQYALIGNPLSHTKSPLIHETFAGETAQSLTYVAIEAEAFAPAVDRFRAQGGKGMNVTAPFKLDAFAYATDLSERARLAGAVNAMRFEGDRVFAENFDGVGLVNDIQRNLGFELKGRRVLILGAGGAARGALLPLLEQNPAQLVMVNRTLEKAQALRQQFADVENFTIMTYADLVGERFDIVLNATSASLRGDLPPVPADVFSPQGLAYELAYGKGLTPFLRLAKGAGVHQLADGVGMLVEQAAEAFLWWRGMRPDTRGLIHKLTIPLV